MQKAPPGEGLLFWARAGRGAPEQRRVNGRHALACDARPSIHRYAALGVNGSVEYAGHFRSGAAIDGLWVETIRRISAEESVSSLCVD